MNKSKASTEAVFTGRTGATTPMSPYRQPGEESTRKIRRVLAYWRRSLAHSDLMTGAETSASKGVPVDRKGVRRGRLRREEAEQILSKHAGESEEEKPDSVEGILAPYCAGREYRDGKQVGPGGRDVVQPLWMYVTLDADGHLSVADQAVSPWIVRTAMTPQRSGSEEYAVGRVADYDAVCAEQSLAFQQLEESDWSRYFELGRQRLEMVAALAAQRECDSGDPLHWFRQSLQTQGYRLLDQSVFLIRDVASGMCDRIINVLDAVAKQEEVPGLLAECARQEGPDRRPLRSPKHLLGAQKRHLGHMTSAFALSESQRRALYHLLEEPNQPILAVNGPPGTGKTTLLNDVIATKWVQSALDDAPDEDEVSSPCILGISSTNNRAVTNVLASLEEAFECDRWIEEVPSLGLYLHNSKRRWQRGDQAGLYHAFAAYTTGGKPTFSRSDFGRLWNEEEGLREAREHFLLRCREYFGEPIADVPDARRRLGSELAEQKELHDEGVEAAARLLEISERIEGSHGSTAQLEEAVEENRQRLREANRLHDQWQAVRADWQQERSYQSPLWVWLVWLINVIGPLRQWFLERQSDRFSEILEQRNVSSDALIARPAESNIESWRTDLADRLQVMVDQAEAEHQRWSGQLQQAQELLVRRQKSEARWNRWSETYAEQTGRELEQLDLDPLDLHRWEHEQEEGRDTNPASPTNALDTTIRRQLFRLAMHYWEARWLETHEPGQDTRDTKRGLERWYRHMAKLTPCFVTTMHSGPAFFSVYKPQSSNEPVLGLLDLLIVDEAGQVSPELATGMLASARQALVVGDTKQLEPIPNLLPDIDEANARDLGLCERQSFRDFGAQTGVTATDGSVMRLAQQRSMWHSEGMAGGQSLPPGVMLREHRRCRESIIGYCDALAYAGHLRSMRSDSDEPEYPHLGYAHIEGSCRKAGGSRHNPIEARAIASWLKKHKEQLQQTFGRSEDGELKPLHELVGIVTPFARQARTLTEECAEVCDDGALTIGTVHTFQGGEAELMIFSPVYDSSDCSSMFFDEVNMLNVAVSRAKESFLVFGDMHIFDASLNTPAGLLAQKLFEAPIVEGHRVNEIRDLDWQAAYQVDQSEYCVDTLERHLRVLRRAFQRAERRLCIVSPFVTHKAVAYANEDLELPPVPTLARQALATSEELELDIYVDQRFVQKEGTTNLKPSAHKGLQALRAAGAAIHICRDIHNKCICVDDEVLVTGSFNWLSSPRCGKYQRYEYSTIHTGREAELQIDRVVSQMERRSMKQWEES